MVLNFSSVPESSKSRSDAVSTVHVFNRKPFGNSSCYILTQERPTTRATGQADGGGPQPRWAATSSRRVADVPAMPNVPSGEGRFVSCCSWNRQGLLWPGTLSILGNPKFDWWYSENGGNKKVTHFHTIICAHANSLENCHIWKQPRTYRLKMDRWRAWKHSRTFEGRRTNQLRQKQQLQIEAAEFQQQQDALKIHAKVPLVDRGALSI